MLARLHAYVSHSWNPTVEPTVQHSRQSSMDSVDTNPQSFLGPCEAASKLPTELHDHIIDSVSRWDMHTLGNCALVSSEWLSRSRQLVFRDVSIHPRKAQAFLRLIAIPWSTIPPYVRSLSLTEGSGMPGQREGAWLNEALTLLMKLQGIDTLRIANANFYGTDLDIIVKFFSNFRKLKELQLLLCDIEHPTNSILGIVITSCRRLESILLDTVMLGPRGAFNPDDQFKIPASLRSVEIRSCNQAVFLDCLVSTNSIPKVDTLYLGPPIFLGQTSRIAHFVNTIGPTLRLLELQCGSGMTFSAPRDISKPIPFDGPTCAIHIRGLALRHANPFRNQVGWIMAILSQITSPRVEEVMFEVGISQLEDLEIFDWDTLAELLELAHFSALKRLYFSGDQESSARILDATPWIFAKLPSLANRGILVVG